MKNFKSGYVALVGEANVGKSTLLNAVVGERLAIVTPKPHTTRKRLLGVYGDNSCQIAFIDTPGFVAGSSALAEMMRQEAGQGAAECDLLALLVDGEKLSRRAPSSEDELLKIAADTRESCERVTGKMPEVVILNKMDLLPPHGALPLIAAFNTAFNSSNNTNAAVDIVPISAKSGITKKGTNSGNLGELIKTLAARLPESEPLFAADELTTTPERILAAETIREQAMLKLREEVPYAVAVDIESFNYESRGREGKLLRIAARIIVEKESQKGIVIGGGGAMLKQIGSAARIKLERFFDSRVFLELVVSVDERWSESEHGLKRVGIL